METGNKPLQYLNTHFKKAFQAGFKVAFWDPC